MGALDDERPGSAPTSPASLGGEGRAHAFPKWGGLESCGRTRAGGPRKSTMLNVELANSKSIVAVHPFQESIVGGLFRPSFSERTSTSTVLVPWAIRPYEVRGTTRASCFTVRYSNTFPSVVQEREGIDQDFGLKLILVLSTSRRSSRRTHPSKGLHRQSEIMRADRRARRDRAPAIGRRFGVVLPDVVRPLLGCELEV